MSFLSAALDPQAGVQRSQKYQGPFLVRQDDPDVRIPLVLIDFR